jgi:broad specificity phosphatase PhoE
MKKIYFVRHGESEGNSGPIRQVTTTVLTQKGIEQADFVAERASKISVDFLISSTMTRAMQTAQIVSEKISKPIDFSDLFVERRRPSEVLGKLKDDPQSLIAEEEIKLHFTEPGWRFSDEENFDDLKARALEALAYLAARPEDNILVVTHGFFLRVIMSCVVFGEDLSGKECQKFVQTFHMENTGMTVLGYDDKNDKNPWWLWVWNDHAHLG